MRKLVRLVHVRTVNHIVVRRRRKIRHSVQAINVLPIGHPYRWWFDDDRVRFVLRANHLDQFAYEQIPVSGRISLSSFGQRGFVKQIVTGNDFATVFITPRNVIP